jgi:hypothetical protein
MHVRDEDLELYLMERLEKAQTVTVEAHLSDCSACAIRLNSANILSNQLAELRREQTPFRGVEKRREPRVTTDDAGVLQKINPFSPDRFDVRVLDVSKDGMRVAGPNSLEPGTNVKVRLNDKIAFGEVRHCRVVGGAYHAGIQLHDTFPL